MISDFKGKTAVLTGAGSGFGLECARIGARLGMNLVLVDVQQDALDAAAAEMRAAGAQVLARKVDVSKRRADGGLAAVATRSLSARRISSSTTPAWRGRPGLGELGPRLGMGAGRQPVGRDPRRAPVHADDAGEAAQGRPGLPGPHRQHRQHGRPADAAQHGHLQRQQACGGGLTETLYQDLKLVTDQVSASVLCPYFVPTGISQSQRNRPADMPAEQKPTQSQLIGQAMSDKAVGSGKVTAAEVAQKVFDAIAADQFYIFSHPKALGNVSDA
jgi:hypothetical protein